MGEVTYRRALFGRDQLLLRFVLLGQSLVLALASVLGLVYFALWSTSVLVIGLGIGIPLTVIMTVLVRWLADRHRGWAVRELGEAIGRPYQSTPAGARWAQLWPVLRDPASWRDWLWLGCNAAVGWLTSGLSTLLFLGGVFYLIYPLLFWLTPPPVLRTPLGHFELSSVQETLVVLPFGVVLLAVWYASAPGLANLNARVMRSLLAPTEAVRLRARVSQLASSRAEAVTSQASELRRIERDLHDGAQARLVSLGMSLGLAEELLDDDPQAARRLLVEARLSTSSALAELRALVRGIHPPVLADRGLDGALQALALANPVPTSVEVRLPGRLPAPVESAAYFAVAEVLANAIKHAHAHRIRILLEFHEAGGEGLLSMVVSDDGRGGATAGGGTGLRGVAHRLAAFDGTLVVDSPLGGPTEVRMSLPCESS